MTTTTTADFKEVFTSTITRHGATALLEWLEHYTDFFTAPASTKFHGAHPGGLAEHSLNVYHRLRQIVIQEDVEGAAGLWPEQEEMVAICGLLHDVCKVNTYALANAGRTEQPMTYTHKDLLPLGHGEKSIFIIQRHMALTDEEALAIRWHMGAYDDAVKGGSRAMGAAMSATPMVWRLHQADMCATWEDERVGN